MALFTDGNVATLNDLRAYETAILDLAGSEGIDLGAKLSLAHREVGFEILSFLLRQGYGVAGQRGLANVITTDPLVHAEVMWTLGLIYRDAFNSQLNDRYEGKWKQYSDLSRRALRQYFEIGVGLTMAPIPKPEPPLVQLMPGGYRIPVTYTVRAAACGVNGYSGALSDPVVVTAGAGITLEVTLGDVLPDRSTGWLLYVGENDQTPARQNSIPLNAGSVWTCPETGPVTDLPSIRVQVPEIWAMQRNQLLRG